MKFARGYCIGVGFMTICFFLCASAIVKAQDNYEIQIYGSETVPKGFTMVELHSNYTNAGYNDQNCGIISTNRALHETVEITHGFNSWMEVGLYLFTSANPTVYRPGYVGDHLRWRARIPEVWHWPVGLSLSVEGGYQRLKYAQDNWNTEIRPIVDKDWKKWYAAINPVLDYAFIGANHNAGLQFAPQFKVGYKITKQIMAGIEYYGSIGSIKNPDPLSKQSNQIGFAVDLDVSPKWELNFGYVYGLSPYVEKGIIKIIVGRRLGKEKA